MSKFSPRLLQNLKIALTIENQVFIGINKVAANYAAQHRNRFKIKKMHLGHAITKICAENEQR